MEKVLSSLEALQQEAAVFIRTLSPKNEATLITLSGELGAGKTSFTQGLARELGINESVTSPTFVLEKVYELPESEAFRRLVHIDAYRLEGASLAPLGFDAVMEDPQNLVVLEWPEKITDGLPQPAVAISLTVLPDTSRSISYTQHHA